MYTYICIYLNDKKIIKNKTVNKLQIYLRTKDICEIFNKAYRIKIIDLIIYRII